MLSDETIRQALLAAGGGLEAGQALAHQPRSRLRAKKSRRDRLIRPGAEPAGLGARLRGRGLVLPPGAAGPARLDGRASRLRLGLHAADRADPEPKALACYGLWLPGRERMLLRFVDGRPVSPRDLRLPRLGGRAARGRGRPGPGAGLGQRLLARQPRGAGLGQGPQPRVKRDGGCRLLICRLPSKSPWLNPIEPKWVHGKRAVVEPERKLTGAELKQRLCDHYRCHASPPLAQQLA